MLSLIVGEGSEMGKTSLLLGELEMLSCVHQLDRLGIGKTILKTDKQAKTQNLM